MAGGKWGPMSKSAIPRIKKREGIPKALALRRQGKRFHEVAEILGIGRSTAQNWVNAALDELRAEALKGADELRQLEASRLDEYLNAIYDRAIGGDIAAIHTALKITESRRKLFGLDAPIKIDAVSTVHTNANYEAEQARLSRLSTDELMELKRLTVKMDSGQQIIDMKLDKPDDSD